MSICDEVPGVEVIVKVAGDEATEYDDTDGPQADLNKKEARHRVFKYIESLDDAHFSIHIGSNLHHFEADDHCLGVRVDIDGKRQCSYVIHQDKEIHGARWERNGVWMRELFKFSQIQTVDSTERARVEKDMASAKDLGLIQVHIKKGGSPTANVSQRLLKLRSIGSMEADCLRRLAGERVRDMKGGRVKVEDRAVVKREINEVYDLTDEGLALRVKRAKSDVVDLTGDD